MLTSQKKQLLKDLLDGKYLRKRMELSGGFSFGVYEGNQVLLYKIDLSKDFASVIKKDRKGRFHLSRTAVRKLHGNSIIKKEYIKATKNINNETVHH